MTPGEPIPTNGPQASTLVWQALAEEIAAVVDPVVCNAWHRGAGVRIARRYPLAVRDTLDAFESGVNEILATLGFGRVRYDFDRRSKMLRIVHEQLPAFDGTSSAPQWLLPFFEGLHSAWLGQQRTLGGTYLSINEARSSRDDGALVLIYGRPDRMKSSALAPARLRGHGPIGAAAYEE